MTKTELEAIRARHGRVPEKLATNLGWSLRDAAEVMNCATDESLAFSLMTIATATGRHWKDVWKAVVKLGTPKGRKFADVWGRR